MLWKHKLNEHKEEEMKVKMKITQKFRDPARIAPRSKTPGELLNSKSELNLTPLARIVIEKRNFVKHCALKNSEIGCNLTAKKPKNLLRK